MSRPRALTLVEVMLAGGMMAFLLTVILSVLNLAVGVYRSSSALGGAYQEISQISDRVAGEITRTRPAFLVGVGPDSPVLGFPLPSQPPVYAYSSNKTWEEVWDRYVLYSSRDGSLYRHEFASPPDGGWKPSSATLLNWAALPGARLVARGASLQTSYKDPWVYGPGAVYGWTLNLAVLWTDGETSLSTPRRVVRVW